MPIKNDLESTDRNSPRFSVQTFPKLQHHLRNPEDPTDRTATIRAEVIVEVADVTNTEAVEVAEEVEDTMATIQNQCTPTKSLS